MGRLRVHRLSGLVLALLLVFALLAGLAAGEAAAVIERPG